METPQLLPCPFCGNAAEFVHPQDKDNTCPYIQCTACGSDNGIRTLYYRENAPAEVVIKRWNARAKLGSQNPSLPPSKLDLEKLDATVLALLALNIDSSERAESDTEAAVELHYNSLLRLHASGMLARKPSLIPEHGVYLSEAGARRAHKLFRKLFCD